SVRCRDNDQNLTEQLLPVAISQKYPPRDPTVQEYLSNLVEFLVPRVKLQDQSRFLQVEDLTAELFQPFKDLLSADATLRTTQVHQLRLCIEILRRYLTKPGTSLTPANQQILQQAEAVYRLATYETLLKRLGTSFTELRTARLADEPTRQALAQRL